MLEIFGNNILEKMGVVIGSCYKDISFAVEYIYGACKLRAKCFSLKFAFMRVTFKNLYFTFPGRVAF